MNCHWACAERALGARSMVSEFVNLQSCGHTHAHGRTHGGAQSVRQPLQFQNDVLLGVSNESWSGAANNKALTRQKNSPLGRLFIGAS